ncbi:hypothetical protein SLEP1_g4617 [Rubroshorea leprosula]|uniref:Neprosin PEP catalytic domain-containing protein n=1 Tax=Rubroshorea leprosula TaxID=152421 RepID=A0AAV5HY63_9ROSI|nr:hypothetical protein SLEP1_g4617 [Rubroshorea leprosula]
MFRDQFPGSYAVNGVTSTGFIPGTVYDGAGGFVSIWNPTVSPGQFSATAVSIEGGPPDQFSVIRVGWIQGVNGVMYGCYNTYCPGFIQTDRTIAVDMILKPISVLRGAQYHVRLAVPQDKFRGNNTLVGYWPGNLFSNLKSGADALKWGGMVYSSTPQVPTMGNGDNRQYISRHFRQIVLNYEARSSLNGTIDAPIGAKKKQNVTRPEITPIKGIFGTMAFIWEEMGETYPNVHK